MNGAGLLQDLVFSFLLPAFIGGGVSEKAGTQPVSRNIDTVFTIQYLCDGTDELILGETT